MPYTKATVAAAIVGLIASTAPVFAFGSIGCTDLPEHDRAVGTIENGPYSCGMSLEEAQRILARDEGQSAPTTVPAPRKHHHHKSVPHM